MSTVRGQGHTSNYATITNASTQHRDTAHRHSGIAMPTPFDVHHGYTDAVHQARAWILRSAYDASPERFVRRPPKPLALPEDA